MQLKSLRYSQFESTPKFWALDQLDFQPVNLIVGPNSSGKSRTLNIINALARILSGRQANLVSTGNYLVEFLHENEIWEYGLHFDSNEVVSETLKKAGAILLDRKSGGFGNIFAEKQGTLVEFQSPPSAAAAFARRDSVQHSFLEVLSSWGASTFHYPFSLGMGQHYLGGSLPNAPPADVYDPNQVLGILRNGLKTLGQPFRDAIIGDMAEIGYPTLLAAGYEEIIAVRDVAPKFTRADTPRLQSAFRQSVQNNPIEPKLVLATMEVEAWFVAEHSHFQRIHPNLTPDRIRNDLNLDVENMDWEGLASPSTTLTDIYWLEILTYTKSRSDVERTVERLDFGIVTARLPHRTPAFQPLHDSIVAFLQ